MVRKSAVLRLDPDLGAGLDGARRSAALRDCQAHEIEVPRGAWRVDLDQLDPDGFGLLVVSGILCRRVVLGESNGAELLGTGDLLRPWDRVGDWSTIPTDASWMVLEDTRLAVLDSDFVQRCAPYPEVAVQLLRRGLLRSRYLAILIALIGQRRIESRLTMLFWHLADRFGQMRGDWVEIPVPLTHAILAELVAARRPSVTTALSRLHANGVLTRTGDVWRLRAAGEAPDDLRELDRVVEPAGSTGKLPLQTA